MASGTVASANVTSVVGHLHHKYLHHRRHGLGSLRQRDLVLQDNGGNNLSVGAGATSFTFTTAIASGSTYNVTVFSQPSNPAQTCGVTAGGSGTVASANVTSVVVTCIDSAVLLTGSMTSCPLRAHRDVTE